MNLSLTIYNHSNTHLIQWQRKLSFKYTSDPKAMETGTVNYTHPVVKAKKDIQALTIVTAKFITVIEGLSP